MNTRAFTLALMISLFAMFLVMTYLDEQESKITKKYGTKKTIVIAKVDIKELELIDDSKVDLLSIPENFVHPSAFKSKKDIENTIAIVPILKGEVITKPRVGYPGTRSGLARQISNGKRAIAVDINDMTGVSKLIKPGDRVDVVARVDYGAGKKDLQMMKTILQDVLVLSVGRSITNNIPLIGIKTPKVITAMNLNTYERYNSITLELDPYQVQKLLHIKIFGGGNSLYLSLRNNSDRKIVNIKSADLFDVLDEDAQDAKKFFFQQSQKGAAGRGAR